MTTTDLTPPATTQTALADRFILTQVEAYTLVFPAIWVTELLRIDRSQILDLPFYDSLLVGIANYNGQMTPLIAAARLLGSAQSVLPERVMVVRLNQAVGQLANVGIIVERAIGSTTRSELPEQLFTAHCAGEMMMMRQALVPTGLWQPQYWSAHN